MVNSEGPLRVFQKTVPKKDPQDSYKLAQNCYTVPRYDTKDIYLYLNLKTVIFYLFGPHFQNTFRIVLRFKITGAHYLKDSSILFADFQIILIIFKNSSISVYVAFI